MEATIRSPEDPLPYAYLEKSNGGPETLTKGKSTEVENGTVHMKRQIGLLGAVSFILVSLLGSGIFISPTLVLRRTNSVATTLLVWTGCGILSFLGALSYCELGMLIPKSGAEYAYVMEVYGPLHHFFGPIPAYLIGWLLCTLTYPSSLALTTLTCSTYALLPILRALGISSPWEASHEDYFLLQKLVTIFLILTIAAINVFSARLATNIITFTAATKILAASLVIGIGLYNLSIGNYGALPVDGYDTSDASMADIAMAFYSCMWAFGGWNNLSLLFEELVNPARNLLLAVCIALPLGTLLMVFMNVSYFTVLTKEELFASEAIGIEVGEKSLGSFHIIMPLLIFLCVFGTAISGGYRASRTAYAVSRDGNLPTIISYVSATRLTPIVSIILTTVFAIVIVLIQSIAEIVNSLGLIGWLMQAMTFGAFFILRYKYPDRKRIVRIPAIIPAIGLVTSLGMIIVPVIDHPAPEFLVPIAYLGAGFLFYYPFVYKKKQFAFMDKLTHVIQFLTLAAPSPYRKD